MKNNALKILFILLAWSAIIVHSVVPHHHHTYSLYLQQDSKENGHENHCNAIDETLLYSFIQKQNPSRDYNLYTYFFVSDNSYTIENKEYTLFREHAIKIFLCRDKSYNNQHFRRGPPSFFI